MPSKPSQLWTDVQLLEFVKDNELKAFEIIYNRYWSKLYLSAYNILRDQQASEDIVQEIMTDLWMKRASSDIEKLNSYLYASVRYKVFKVIRSGNAREDLFSEIEQISVENDAERLLIEKDFNRMLDQALSRLPERCRDIFLLSRKEHLSTREIAERLGISPKTVEGQITIALRRLRPVLSKVVILAACAFLSNLIDS
jgi:RNA polymerase sigma-70 factor (family 1)